MIDVAASVRHGVDDAVPLELVAALPPGWEFRRSSACAYEIVSPQSGIPFRDGLHRIIGFVCYLNWLHVREQEDGTVEVTSMRRPGIGFSLRFVGLVPGKLLPV